MQQIILCIGRSSFCRIKGKLMSKANRQAKDSSKKRTNEFIFTSMQRVFVRFLEESSARKKMFRDYLTFSVYRTGLHQKLKPKKSCKE